MSQQVVFTRAFSQVVWLLVYRPGSSSEQKQALRAALLETQEEGFVVSLAELNRAIAAAASLSPMPNELPWLSELAARMAGHSVGLLDFAHGAKAVDVLGVARVLAMSSVQGDEGAAFDARLQSLQLTTVSARLGRAGFVRKPTPIAGARIPFATPARTPAMGMSAMEGAAMEGRPLGVHRRGLSRRVGIGSPTPSVAMSRLPSPEDDDDVTPERDQMVEAAFTQTGQRVGLDAQLARLMGVLTGDAAPALLADLTRTCEEMARDGLWVDVAQALHALVRRERDVTDVDVKRAFLINLRHLFKPGVLRGLAQLLARRRDLRPAIEAVFVRAGDVGADVLIDLLVSSSLASERRAYRTALAGCPAAVEPLMHLLQDPRWYVVRNAAELLGDMGAEAADGKLLGALKHGDARVRRSAAGALARLGTARGVYALQPLLSDGNAAVRLQVVHGISSARLPRSVPALVQALEREDDPEIQSALLASLGMHPTDEAVIRLAEAAQPGSLLYRKASTFRLAAVHALAEAGTPAALSALRALQGDRDRAIRSAVERALVIHAQGAVVVR